MFGIASFFTKPVCNLRETYVKRQYRKELDPTPSKVMGFIKSSGLFSQIAFYAALTPITAPLGILFRQLGILFSSHPYTHLRGEAPEIELGETCSFFSWNVCLVPAGYCITDGGVVPPEERVDQIIEKILEEDADVVSLCEVMDHEMAMRLYEGLKGRYANFVVDIGVQTAGPPSALFVASKGPIRKMKFRRFSPDMLDGRTKKSGKGVFSFEVASKLHFFVTHLQHSEEVQNPTAIERHCRELEMQYILRKMQKIEVPSILAGDLNFDSAEHRNSSWKKGFAETHHWGEGEKTWMGDQFCARMTRNGDCITGTPEKNPSPPCNLDWVLTLLSNPVTFQEIRQVETGYDPTLYNQNALSDHRGQYRLISLV